MRKRPALSHVVCNTLPMLIGAALILAVTQIASAQYDKLKIEMYDQITLGEMGASAGNDCWGYTSGSGREYALMGVNNKMVVVEISDPANSVIVDTVSHSSSTWGDIKVYQDYAYVCNESGGGIQIISLASIDSGSVSLIGSFGPSTNHNIAINEDSGFLYTAGSGTNGGRPIIYSLANPAAPTLVASVGSGVSGYSHDNHARTYTSGPYAGKEILFAANEGRGVYIIDVTNKSNISQLSATSYPGVSYCHQLWTNDDGTLLYVDDELDELYGTTPVTRTLVFDIADLSNPVLVNTFTSGYPASDHNLYYHDDLIFEANYTIGLRVFDAAVDPIDPPEIAYFDTYPGNNSTGFEGAWSTFPYFESGTVIVSDINRGLFVLDATQVRRGLKFTYPEGRPDLFQPGGGTTFLVDVTGEGGVDPEPDTGVFHYNDGSGWRETPMIHLGSNQYRAEVPPTECGAVVEYYVAALTTDLEEGTDPPNAPTNAYSAVSASALDEVFADNFETNKGWTVEDFQITGGSWERGVPAGNGDRGDPTMDADGSGQCYLTENGPDNTDVDGGPTSLISPIIDLGDGDAIISYAKWFTNDDGDGDSLDVWVSNDGGSNWALVEVSGPTGGWQFSEFRVSDYVAPTSQVRVKFDATDNPNDSVTEAGIDAFAVNQTQCTNEQCLILYVEDLIGGQAANFTVTEGTPGATAIVLYSLQDGSLNYCPGSGPWCVAFDIDIPLNKAQQRIVVQGTINDGGVFSQSRFIPGNFSGVQVKFQAAESDTYPDPCMSNVVDQVIQ